MSTIASPIRPQPNYVYYAEASQPLLQAEGIAHSPDDYVYIENEDVNKPPPFVSKEKIDGWLKKYAKQYSVSYEEMKRVMLCESTGKIDAIGDNGKAYGLFQFWENTFNLFSKEMGESLEYKNPEDQVKLASWAFSKGKQPHWSCWKR